MMTVNIHPSHYKDQRAVTIESERVAAQFLPAIGTNLCSLVYKPLGRELLIQRPGTQYKVAPYAGDYVIQGECAGMDDMFPTIDRCYYERDPWQATPLPDHGEVWSIPWDTAPQDVIQPDAIRPDQAIGGDCLRFVTHGIRLPYTLEKTISFADAGTLHIAYRLTNHSPFDMDFLWAAHPMFTLEEGAELVLPDDVQHIVTVSSPDGKMGGHGDEHTWPMTELSDGTQRDLRRIQPKASKSFVKYYVKGRLATGWCALTYPVSRLALRLSFPAEQVPYLGILPNEGGWQDLYNIFLEPATASFDRPDVARLRGECSAVGANSTYEWYLDIAISATSLSDGVVSAGANPAR
jgi:hypothetical protein